DKQFLQNFAGTAYVKNGDNIFEITNNGSAQDIVFDIDAQTGMLVPVNAPGVSVNKMSTAVFSSLNGNNFSSVINPGETQYMMFTINGVQRVYKVTNNSADKQSVIYEKTNGVSITSGDGVVIDEYSDMVRSTGIGNDYFYLDFSTETQKNININGRFYEITNNDGSTALFRINGNNIVQVAGSSASITSKQESTGINSSASQYEIEIQPDETKYIKIGDSVAVNGVCLTIESFKNNNVTFFGAQNTFNITNLKYLKINDKINLERALKLSSRLDGHILTGHVETTVKVLDIQKNMNTFIFKFEMPNSEFNKYICYKGSVGINGISLTVSNIGNKYFETIIIRHTLDKTNFKYLEIGSYVNIETDILAKYVENMLKSNNNESKIDYNKLNEFGFI
ncbi:MAG: hypothetical protein BHW07_01695, partial [Clostridium sp. CAG_433_25_7]